VPRGVADRGGRLEAAIPAWRKAQAKLQRQLSPDLARRLAAAAETLN
jgi:hypothetical protein